MVISYYAEPDKVTAIQGSGSTIDIDNVLQPLLIDYVTGKALMDAASREDNPGIAQIRMASAQQCLANYKEGLRKFGMKKNDKSGGTRGIVPANMRQENKVATEVSKDSKFTFSLETLISLAVTIFMVVGMWFTLQADIKEAKELPEPPIGRTEYDLKDQMIRNSIMNTEDKVEKLEEKVDDIKEDTKAITQTLIDMNNK